MNNKDSDEHCMIMASIELILPQIDSNSIKNEALFYDYYYVQECRLCVSRWWEQEKWM